MSKLLIRIAQGGKPESQALVVTTLVSDQPIGFDAGTASRACSGQSHSESTPSEIASESVAPRRGRHDPNTREGALQDPGIQYHLRDLEPVTNLAEPKPAPVRIAIAIPCFNEAPAIAQVIAGFRVALPEAEIFVFDNNSTDGTGEIARGLGVQSCRCATRQGACRPSCAGRPGRVDVVVLTDGDGTYPAEAAPFSGRAAGRGRC